MQTQLKRLGLASIQNTHFSLTETSFAECAECAAAYSESLRGDGGKGSRRRDCQFC